MVDSWEAFQSYQRTAIVLDHFDHEINTILGGVTTQEGEHRTVRPMLLAGSDLIATMSEPGVWSYSDVRRFMVKTSQIFYVNISWTTYWVDMDAWLWKELGQGLTRLSIV